MPWMETSAMKQRTEFVMLASAPDANVRQLCRGFGIQPSTAYKWLKRYRLGGPDGLAERSRRPKSSPNQTRAELEQAVLMIRGSHPAWGGRKIRARLRALGHETLPAASTITDILHRHGLIDPEESAKRQQCVRFERAEPNELWQMDFKGHFATGSGRCHPLTVLDDHSRFAVGLYACADEKLLTVQGHLTAIFRRYGLPGCILSDNGRPWGAAEHRYTQLSAWLIRLGVNIAHGRPYHPQTQGKDERFHRTLNVEVLRGRSFRDTGQVQEQLDCWRDVYNLQRPHEALDLKPPCSRYRPSSRPFPEELPSIEYGPGDQVRKVGGTGTINYRGREIFVSEAFRGLPVALRPSQTDGTLDVFFCHQKINQIDLREPGHV